MDSFLNVVGELDVDSLSSILKRDSDTVEIRKADLKTVANPAHPKSAPDHILLQGKLAKNGAPASIAFRTASKSIDDVGVRWTITGTRGEIEITANRGQWQIESGSKKLRLRLYDSDEVREFGVDPAELGVASTLGDSTVNTALIIDGFTTGAEDSFVDFAESLKVHKLLDAILAKSGYLSTV